jgi:hypothetical protein
MQLELVPFSRWFHGESYGAVWGHEEGDLRVKSEEGDVVQNIQSIFRGAGR